MMKNKIMLLSFDAALKSFSNQPATSALWTNANGYEIFIISISIVFPLFFHQVLLKNDDDGDDNDGGGKWNKRSGCV